MGHVFKNLVLQSLPRVCCSRLTTTAFILSHHTVSAKQRLYFSNSPGSLRNRESDAKVKTEELSQRSVEEEQRAVAREKQRARPWHRADEESEPSDSPSDPTRGDPTKGRLLTTPTRLLKLVLPLPAPLTGPTSQKDPASEDIYPLALAVHPHQPLSYLERLIQAELPPIKVDGNDRIPNLVFLAEADHTEDKDHKDADKTKSNHEGNVASYSGLGHEGPKRDRANWVRWSTSTEVGDFIRDAARGREFSIDIEGFDKEIRVAVPSFNDRTYYMRVRLRKMSRQIEDLAKIKQECDALAHRGAHRIAKGGFGLLAGWWGVVYYVTFHTDFGWDLVEPVTYLAGLTTIMGAYLWFLFISRDLSYKAALNITVSRRQNSLYQARGFDLNKWEQLVHDANALRREIKMVASEYDADWNETKDLGGEEVLEVLEKEKQSRKKPGKDADKEDDKPEQDTGGKDGQGAR